MRTNTNDRSYKERILKNVQPALCAGGFTRKEDSAEQGVSPLRSDVGQIYLKRDKKMLSREF